MTDYSAAPVMTLTPASLSRPTSTAVVTSMPRAVRSNTGMRAVVAPTVVRSVRASQVITAILVGGYTRATVTPTRTAWVNIARGGGSGTVVVRPSVGQLWPRARSLSS